MSKFGQFHIFSQIDVIGQSPRGSVIFTNYYPIESVENSL